jgi:hypothetical protein
MPYVYGLFEPKNTDLDTAFYIGKGSRTRLNYHLTDRALRNPDNPHLARKIRVLRGNGVEPYSRKIVGDLSHNRALEMEARLIEELGQKNLTNIKSGGSGGPLPAETKQRISLALTGREFTEEHKRRIAEAQKGREHPEEVKRKMSESHRGRENSEEHNRNISRAKRGFSHTEEAKKKMSKSHKGKTLPEETKRKLCESRSDLKKKEAREVKWLAWYSNYTHREIASMYTSINYHVTVSRINLEKVWAHVDPKQPEDFGQLEIQF